MSHARTLFALASVGALALATTAAAADPAAAPAPPRAPATPSRPAAPPERGKGPPETAARPAKPATPAAPNAPASKPPTPAASPTSAKPGAAPSAEDRKALADRVVIIERAGRALGLGVILNGDGRIVAALSSLAGAQHLDAHYADDKRVPVRVGHADRAHDLALLVPANAEHQLGLKASLESAEGLHAPLGSFVAAGGKAVPGPLLTPAGPSAFLTNEGKPYPAALAFTTPAPPATLGSPLIDATGEVVAVITRACQKRAGSACAPAFVGTPVSVIREFLRHAPKTAALPRASLGLEVVADDTGTVRGLRVTSARGPAAALGLHAGRDAKVADVIVALDGIPVTSPEAFEHAIADHAVGDVVDLLVLGLGRYRHVTAVIAATR